MFLGFLTYFFIVFLCKPKGQNPGPKSWSFDHMSSNPRHSEPCPQDLLPHDLHILEIALLASLSRKSHSSILTIRDSKNLFFRSSMSISFFRLFFQILCLFCKSSFRKHNCAVFTSHCIRLILPENAPTLLAMLLYRPKLLFPILPAHSAP